MEDMDMEDIEPVDIEPVEDMDIEAVGEAVGDRCIINVRTAIITIIIIDDTDPQPELDPDKDMESTIITITADILTIGQVTIMEV